MRLKADFLPRGTNEGGERERERRGCGEKKARKKKKKKCIKIKVHIMNTLSVKTRTFRKLSTVTNGFAHPFLESPPSQPY